MAGDRRERYREQTRDEAKAVALEQLAEGGTGALSLNAIAREIGLSGPALYRYFANRDELLTALVIDAFTAFGDAIEHAAAETAGRPAEARLRAILLAFRAQAGKEPHRYQLLWGTPVPGYQAPTATIAAAGRIFALPLEAAVALSAERDAADPTRRPPPGTELDRQLAAWYDELDAPPHLIRAAILAWSRLHGLLSLEINGSFGPMRFDRALLYAAEVDAIIAAI